MLLESSRLRIRTIVALLGVGLVGALAAQAPAERIDAPLNTRIRDEGLNRSQIMRISHVLTDVYGGRLTGSPNYQNAAEWAVKEMASWGMTNAHLEPWEWSREGWSNEKASGHIIAPVKD